MKQMRTQRFGRTGLASAALALAVGLGSLGAHAQVIGGRPAGGQTGHQTEAVEELAPPIPRVDREGGAPFMSIAIGVLLVGLVVGVSLIPSKRGHQD